MSIKPNKGEGKTGGVKRYPQSLKPSAKTNYKKEWKFTLDPWHEVADMNAFVGSTFIISRLDVQRNDNGMFKYDIYISPLPEQDPMCSLYPSVMDACHKARNTRRKSNKALSKKKKS